MSTTVTREPVPQSGQPVPASPSNGSIKETASIKSQQDQGKVLTQEISLVSPLSRRRTSIGATGSTDPDFEVDWDDENDPMNPRNWPMWYKGLTIGFISWSTWVFDSPPMLSSACVSD